MHCHNCNAGLPLEAFIMATQGPDLLLTADCPACGLQHWTHVDQTDLRTGTLSPAGLPVELGAQVLDWNRAIHHLSTVLDCRISTIGQPDDDPIVSLASLHQLKARLAAGERTRDLYHAIMAAE